MAFESFLATPRRRERTIGKLNIKSGAAVMLWATENASGLDLRMDATNIEVSGELAIENSALAIYISNDIYEIRHADIENDFGRGHSLIIYNNR